MPLHRCDIAHNRPGTFLAGLSPLQAGLTILPIPLGAFVAGPIAGLTLPRFGAERILSSSLALSALGALLYLLG